MNIGVIKAIGPNSKDGIFDLMAELGLTTCQLNIWDTSLYTDELAASILRQSQATGVKPCALWAGYCEPRVWNYTEGPTTLGLVPPQYRARRVEELKRGGDFARKLGLPAIVTHCGFIPENLTDPEYRPVVDAIGEVASHCRDLGVGFWFETGQETPIVLLRVIQDLGLDNLGINLDPANLLLYGKGNPIDALDVFGPYVRNVHVKDGLQPTDGHSLGREVQVGKGQVNFPAFIRKLKNSGFDGELVIEREIPAGPEQRRDIIETIENLKLWWNA